jgi:hypothetical protein
VSRRLVLLVVLALAAGAAPAHAARPANDNRVNAQSLDPLPATVTGTTQDATVEKNTEPFSDCGEVGPSVWYRTTPGAAGRIVLTLQADGDLDVVVDVFRRVRSQVQRIRCDASDAKGQAGIGFRAGKAGSYLIRVSQLPTSVPGTFTLHVSAPIVPARPPGAGLPAAGVTRTLDRVENTDDAWSAVLHAGTTYRMRLSGRNNRCFPHARVYRPGTRSFTAASPVKTMRCGGYLTFTPRPGQSGRYSIQVEANGSTRGPQPYHLQVARAGRDDTTPGIPIGNHASIHAALRAARVDAVDLYRFDVTKRSVTFIDLKTSVDGFHIVLLTERGRGLGSDPSSLHRGLRPGHYYVAVRAGGTASGTYTLTRNSRVITRTRVTFESGTPGQSLAIASETTPAESGPMRFVVERYDPLAGWQFSRRIETQASGGHASASYTPPGPGVYRVKAAFRGTRDVAPSISGWVQAEVGKPTSP